MFFLEFLFVLLLIAFIIMLAYTIYTKITHPEQAFMDCIPFMNDFQQNNGEDLNAEADDSATPTEPLKVASTETKVSEKSATDADKARPVKAKTVAGAKKTEKKPAKSKATASKIKTSKPKTKAAKSKTTKNKGDNIKKINGIGPVFEKKLNSIGINKFEHIAAWTKADAVRIDEQLELAGRPQREDWIAKAKILAAEKNT